MMTFLMPNWKYYLLLAKGLLFWGFDDDDE